VGDKVSDLEAGQHAGCRTILVLTGHGSEHVLKLDETNRPSAAVETLTGAAEWIEQHPAETAGHA
jgi:phosphoglycolate phosphatase-like HAD superfamily hydrolase